MTKKLAVVAEKMRAKRNNSKSLSNSSTLTAAKGMAPPDIQGFSVAFNKIQLGSSTVKMVPNSLDEIQPKSTYLQEDIDDKPNTIPSEIDNQLHRSKTVFNEDKLSIDNHSILKSPGLSPVMRKSVHSESMLTPDMFKDVIQLYKVRRSSITNSNDQKYLARSFSVFEKQGDPIPKESP